MRWTKPLGRDLSDLEVRKNLTPRRWPYWSMLCRNRGIGVEVVSAEKAVWVARAVKKTNRRTAEKWLGITCDSQCSGGITYDDAVQRAWDWFSTLPTDVYADAIPPGRSAELLYSPWGDVYTVAHAIQEYIEWKEPYWTRSSLWCALSAVNFYILPQLGQMAVCELKTRHIQKFIEHIFETSSERVAQRAGRKIKFETLDDESLRKRKDRANEILGHLRSALMFAWENEKTENERCWKAIKPFRTAPGPRLLHLNRSECRQLLKQCPRDLASLVQGALYTGCRLCELTRLRVEDVAREGYGVYVAPGKTYQPRLVFLPDEGMAFFLSLKKGRKSGDLLFTTAQGAPWGRKHNRLFKRAVKAARLPTEFTFHGLRHTYASQLVQAGAPLIVVAQQLGHVNINSVSAYYAHLAPQIREAEVRQRFTQVDHKTFRQANKQKQALTKLHLSFRNPDWRGYAKLLDVPASFRRL